MNKKPVSYLQTDKRWAKKLYGSYPIGTHACGPTCFAMLVETLTGKTMTPAEACDFAVKNGGYAGNSGTYYSFFASAFPKFGISCSQMGWENLYGKPGHALHEKAFALLKQGYYLIALMGKGTWTSGGHFVVVWWEDGKVRINDPASTKDSRVNGDLKTFLSQVKYYWCVDAREYNKEEEEDTMTYYKTVSEIPYEEGKTVVQKLVDREVIKGADMGNLNLSDEMVRMLIFNDRAGLYGGAE